MSILTPTAAMYRSLSMAKINQLTPQERLQKSVTRKQNIKRAQKRVENNYHFYKEVQGAIFEANKYGPVYFYFPETKEPFQKVKNIEEFNKVFQYQKRCSDINLDTKVIQTAQTRPRHQGEGKYKIKNVKVFCRQCGPKLIMKYISGQRTGEEFRLIYFDNSHHHDKQGYNNQMVSTRKYQEVATRKRSTLSTMDWKNVMQQIFQKSKEDRMYYLRHPMYKYLPRFRRIFSNYKFQIMEMNYLNWQYWYEASFQNFSVSEKNQPFTTAPDDNPDFFMIIHPEMKTNFMKYGNVCYMIIIEDGIIRKKETYYEGIKFWSVIAFTGLTQQNRFAPFCFVFLEIAHHSPNNVSAIAKKFFNVMNKEPKVIITPSDQFYEEMIFDMRTSHTFSGKHLFDPICQLQKISQTLENPEHFKYFYNLVQSTNPTDYNYNLQLLFRTVKPSKISRKLLNEFLSKASRMCFGLIETTTFIGLTFLYSGNKYMNNYYKWNFIQKWEIDIKALNDENRTYSNKYDLKEFVYMVVHQISRMFERGVNYLENRGRFEGKKYQDVVDSKQFYKVRYMVKNDINDLIMKQYGKSIELQVRQRPCANENYPQMKVFDIYDRKLKSIFIVAPQPEYDKDLMLQRIKWRCNCLYSYKSGLPCSHQIKMSLVTNSSLFDQINQYWHCQNKNKRVEYWTQPRKTRRNRQK